MSKVFSEVDLDSVMLWIWVAVFAICLVAMPINVYAYLADWINEKQLILITLILSYNALQLSAAGAIVTAISARRVKRMTSEG